MITFLRSQVDEMESTAGAVNSEPSRSGRPSSPASRSSAPLSSPGHNVGVSDWNPPPGQEVIRVLDDADMTVDLTYREYAEYRDGGRGC